VLHPFRNTYHQLVHELADESILKQREYILTKANDPKSNKILTHKDKSQMLKRQLTTETG
jgi:hypothetical protein